MNVKSHSIRETIQAVNEWIDQNSEHIVGFLKRIVSTPSVTGEEIEIQQIMSGKMKQIGLKVDMWEPNLEQLRQHPSCIPVDYHNYENRKNVVGIWQGKGNGKSLLLNGHVDVVPAGPEQLWEYGPWSAVIQNGKMYGRGTSDMKGGVASMIYAVEAIRSLGVHLKGDLIIESVVDEEAGGNGTLSACLRGYNADAAIVPEPTQLNICPAHRGAQFFRVNVWGKGAHAGLRFEGVSALEKAQILINAIRQLESERDRVARKNILYAQYPIASPITIGKLASGVWPAMVPEECTFEGMIDIMPGESISRIREQFKQCIEQTASKDSWLRQHPPGVEWFGVSMNGIQTDLEHPLVQLSKNVIFQILGKDPEILGFPAGSDLRLLHEASGMHGIHIGPGDLRRAHGFNEFVELSQVIDCTKILSAMIIHWCELAE